MIGIHHLLKRQLPEFVREKYPTFCKFLDYYYRWLGAHGFSKLENITDIDLVCDAIYITNADEFHTEISHSVLKSYIGYEIKDTVTGARASILGISDDGRLLIRYITQDAKFGKDHNGEIVKIVDQYNLPVYIENTFKIPTIFIENFSNLLDANKIIGFDQESIVLLLKHIKEYYTMKGTEKSIEFLLYALKNVDSKVMYPWENVLKPSDGHWHQYYSIALKTTKEYIELLKNSKKELTTLNILDYGPVSSKSFNIKSVEYFKNKKYALDDTGEEYEQYIRIHLFEKPNISYFDVGHICTIETDANLFYGTVVNDVVSVEINYPGSNWIVGEVFKIGGTNEWAVEDSSYDKRDLDPIDGMDTGQWWKRYQVGLSTENDSDYNVNSDVYSAETAELPFLGRITATDSGAVSSVEILQQGEYISEKDEGKLYTISPILYENRSSWDESYNAIISFKFDKVRSSVGYWDDERGFLSYPDIVLQDSYYYQQYSYDVFTENGTDDDIRILTDLHPVGTKQFNTKLIVDTWDLTNNLQFDISFPYVLLENCFSEVIVLEKLAKTVDKDLTGSYKTCVVGLDDDYQKIFTKDLTKEYNQDKTKIISALDYKKFIKDLTTEEKQDKTEILSALNYKDFTKDLTKEYNQDKTEITSALDFKDFTKILRETYNLSETSIEKIYKRLEKDFTIDFYRDIFAVLDDEIFVKEFTKSINDITNIYEHLSFDPEKAIVDTTDILENYEREVYKELVNDFYGDIVNPIEICAKIPEKTFSDSSDLSKADYGDTTNGIFFKYYYYYGYDSYDDRWYIRSTTPEGTNISFGEPAFIMTILTNLKRTTENVVFVNKNEVPKEVSIFFNGLEYAVQGKLPEGDITLEVIED